MTGARPRHLCPAAGVGLRTARAAAALAAASASAARAASRSPRGPTPRTAGAGEGWGWGRGQASTNGDERARRQWTGGQAARHVAGRARWHAGRRAGTPAGTEAPLASSLPHVSTPYHPACASPLLAHTSPSLPPSCSASGGDFKPTAFEDRPRREFDDRPPRRGGFGFGERDGSRDASRDRWERAPR